MIFYLKTIITKCYDIKSETLPLLKRTFRKILFVWNQSPQVIEGQALCFHATNIIQVATIFVMLSAAKHLEAPFPPEKFGCMA
jgi:hypothetical protein